MNKCELTFEQIRALINGQSVKISYSTIEGYGRIDGHKMELVPQDMDDSTNGYYNNTRLIVGCDDVGYYIDIFIGGIKTPTARRYNDKLIALSDALRIMTGLRLPSEALTIQFK